MRKVEYFEGQPIGDYGCFFVCDKIGVYYGKSLKRCCTLRCKCGREFIAVIDTVLRGATKSCGCLNDMKRKIPKRTTHGMCKTKLYRKWSRMKARCYNKSNKDYPDYGGRGITVCDEWIKSFVKFYEDMAGGYEEHLELDRKDVNGNYCKENCRWVTEQEQAWNKRVYKNNRSGVAGVTWNKKAGRWEARISKDRKEYYLGFYVEKEAAIKARLDAEIVFYGQTKGAYL